MDDEHSLQIFRETLKLPGTAADELETSGMDATLSQASDVLMAKTEPPDLASPSVEIIMKNLLARLEEERLGAGKPLAHLWYYPSRHRFAVLLSHDVDEIRWSWRRKLLMGALHPSTLSTRGQAYWNFEKIMALEESQGVRATFFVVPAGTHPKDPPYSLADLVATIRGLASEGWEVGVHGSFESFDRLDMLASQKRALEDSLGRSVAGVRQHFINFKSPVTWRLQQEAGFIYDTTVASREKAGFRTGFCHPYRPQGLRLIEIPLTVMDGQLFWYERLDEDRAYERTMALVRSAAEHKGVACLNWHQHTMDEYSFPGWWAVFRRVLKDLVPMNPWFATGEEIAVWWNRRSGIRFEEDRVMKGSAAWKITDPVGGPATLRIVLPSDETLKIQVVGPAGAYEALEEKGQVWLSFKDLPAAETVEVSVRRS